MLEGDPCSIVENEFVKPGKGQAFNRVKLKNLKSGRVWERTFKSGETLESADVMEHEMEFLYSDGDYWHFMRTDGSYDQLAADQAAVDEMRSELNKIDMKGRVVKVVNNGHASSVSAIEWNGRDQNGIPVPSGTYFFKFNDIDNAPIQKILYLK